MVTVPTFTDGSGGGREMGEIVWDPARRRVAGTTILYNTRMCTYTPVKRHVGPGWLSAATSWNQSNRTIAIT